MTIAVITTGGKQYLVEPGTRIRVEKLEGAAGSDVSFNEVLLIADGDTVRVGKPLVSGASVSAKVLGQGRAGKKIVFKFKSKTRSRKKKGHRQPFTEVEITNISV
ncbi:MAG: 50S ribosomal protein L21 [Candidatus Colwellbacteria bacterium]|nr:50S ribosomal protein L21 [Candidatus Colwellbacteria bacterium]